MTDMELAEEIERRRGGTDMLNSVLMRHQWDQIIAALRRGPDVAFEAEKNFLHGKLAEKLERACSKRPLSGEMVMLSDLIKVLEDVHDSHKRKGLPLTDSQFAKLNKARSMLSAAEASKEAK